MEAIHSGKNAAQLKAAATNVGYKKAKKSTAGSEKAYFTGIAHGYAKRRRRRRQRRAVSLRAWHQAPHPRASHRHRERRSASE